MFDKNYLEGLLCRISVYGIESMPVMLKSEVVNASIMLETCILQDVNNLTEDMAGIREELNKYTPLKSAEEIGIEHIQCKSNSTYNRHYKECAVNEVYAKSRVPSIGLLRWS